MSGVIAIIYVKPRIHLFLCFISPIAVLFSANSYASDIAQEAKDWYLTEYAPLSYSVEEMKPPAFIDFYLDDFRVHPQSADSTATDTNSAQAWKSWYESLVEDGWLGGRVEWIGVEALNQYTVVIKARWTNRYSDGATDTTCDWYLATKNAGKWKFASYVQVDCDGFGTTDDV